MKRLIFTFLMVFAAWQGFAQEKDYPKTSREAQKSFFYPNPVDDFIIMAETVPAGQLMIYDISGREIKRFYYSGEGLINLQDLRKGVYVIKISRFSALLKKT
jgi:hypothetical protein